MKVKTFFQIFCLILAGFTAQNISAQFDEGTGTPDDPYLISTAEQLNSVRFSPGENRCYKLTADINLGAWIEANTDEDIQTKGWKPIDVTRKIFDGDGHKIYGFWINRQADDDGDGQGLFHQVNVEMSNNEYGNDAVIKNLTIEIDNDKKVIGNRSTGVLIGIVNGNEDGEIPVKIINCHVIGNIESKSTVGGLVGRVQAPLEMIGCSFSGSIQVYDEWDATVGGLIGQKYEGRAPLTIKDCFVTNSVITGKHSNTGGIGGTIGPNSTIENCYVETTTVTCEGTAGGLIGNWGGKGNADNFRFASSMKNSHSTATVTGNQNIGGLIGEIEARYGDIHPDAEERAFAFDIIDCYAEGELSGSSQIGGLVGKYTSDGGLIIDSSIINNCYANVTISNMYGEIGGLIGNSDGCKNLELKNSHSDMTNTIIYGGTTGGLVGIFGATGLDASSIYNCYATGSIQGNDLGGLVGIYQATGTVEDCYATNDLSGNVSGGLIGSIKNIDNNPINIVNCYRTGNVIANGGYGGGLIGTFESGNGSLIDNCYVEGDISAGYTGTGGLIGSSASCKNLTISNSHYNGKVLTLHGGTGTGGLVGIFGFDGADNSAIINSYAIGAVEGSHSGGLVGRHQSGGSIEKCYAINSIKGGYWSEDVSAGGLVGDAVYYFILKQNYAGGNIIGQHNLGGLVGRYLPNANGSVIDECYSAFTSIIGEYDAQHVGGLVGLSEGITLKNSFAINESVQGVEGSVNRITDDEVTNNVLENNRAFSGTLLNGNTLNPENGTLNNKNGLAVTKEAIVNKNTYESAGWDFTDVWAWGNEYYRLPVLKGLEGQPEEQPSYLPLNNNAKLSSLSLSFGNLDPTFDSDVTEYALDVPYIIENLDVSAVTDDEKATVTGAGAFDLSTGANEISITVLAEDQMTGKEYLITVNRKDATSDATLSELTVSQGELAPAFNPLTFDYTVTLGNSITAIDITATANSSNATVSGDGQKDNLSIGNNEFVITVTAEDGSTQETYTVNIYRKSADATLKTLTVNRSELTPAFDPETTEYTVSVENSITNITISAEANDAKARVSGDGQKNNLVVGNNSFTITVTAEDGNTQNYIVTVTREQVMSIENIKKDVRFYVVNQTIVIEGAEGEIILTSLQGYYQKFAAQQSTRILVNAKGVYILTVNNISYKITVK
ncbi:MAG: cadherin-like beta sandwich domain-containing protein [Dysgonamonadaceae bacterium]|jgi:hypothetical protein|nr:cadherin-like beta sandwich domain-containing protein [Dysgonamonadaceae bacterium]